MRQLRAHPVVVTLLAFAIAVVAVAAMAAGFGFAAFARAWSNVHPVWLGLAVAGQLLAVPSYVLAYRAVSRFDGGPRLALPAVLRIVMAGFGPSAAGGGFALDRHALDALHPVDDAATERVLGLGALEWVVLAPAAWVAVVVLLATGAHQAMPSLLWPWAIAVPIGFALGFSAATPERRRRLASRGTRAGEALGKGLSGVAIVASLATGFWRCWQAWTGVLLYWTMDVASLYACVRFVGVRVSPAAAVVAFATGYALTRRSMPLGGAGVTEVLMTLALHWVGLALSAALAAVVVYRAANFVLPSLPALLVRRRVYPLVRAAAEGRQATRWERGRAGA